MILIGFIIASCLASLLAGILIGAAKADLRASRQPEDPIDTTSEAFQVLVSKVKEVVEQRVPKFLEDK